MEIKNTTVAVIGACGFLGSHLVKHLIEDRGCAVIALDNLITGQMKFLHPKAKFIWCDITKSESELRRIFELYNVQYVFNYAAMPYIPFSFERPIHTFDVNAVGALKVINAAQDAKVKGILQVSSAEIYGNAHNQKIDEKYPANPHSTYGASKLAIDVLVQARYKEAQTPVIALRQFNCIGENETHPYVIPEIIKQLSKSETVWLGNNSFRDFQYAGDAVRMAVELLEKGQFGEVYNMGSEQGIQIYDLAQLIGQNMGHKKVNVEIDQAKIRPWEIWHLQSDNTKLYSVINYRPKTTLEKAIRLTIRDFRENGFTFI